MPLPAEFSAGDLEWLMRGFHFSGSQLFWKLSAVDLPALGLDFQIAIFFFEGTDDQQAPIELAEEYFSRIEAPTKAFVRFEGCHHFVVMNRPADFLAALVQHVLPVASTA
jgi:pimeloyl-ACP methyl ester carboxylesterase